MKHLILFFSLVALLSACQNSNTDTKIESTSETTQAAKSIDTPKDLDKVFDQHGSVALWNKMKTMSYEIVKEEGNEKQTIDLIERKEVIDAPTFKSGYDGKEYWVEADTTYKGNAKFYTNLMFYFYAMPFVLADEGITYTPAKTLTFEGVDYPGYKITYGEGIGVSPQDEYFIHYDAKTYEMAWLGYTVTYFSGEPSTKISWIRYDDWKNFNGLKLPNSLTWYKVEEGKIIEPKKTREFVNVKVSEVESDASIFSKTAGAKVVE